MLNASLKNMYIEDRNTWAGNNNKRATSRSELYSRFYKKVTIIF